MATLFSGGLLFDGDAAPIDGQGVLVEAGRVTEVAPRAEFDGFAGAEVDTTGATLLPGLIDCHVHLCLGGEADPGTAADKLSAAGLGLKALERAQATLAGGVIGVRDCGAQHLLEFPIILRRHHDEIRHGPQEGEIEQTMMGGSVRGRESGPIEDECDGQILQTDIVDDLVVAALEKRRVDRDHRVTAAHGQSRSHRDRMLFGDADIEEPIRKTSSEFRQSGSTGHGGRDRHDAVILLGES